MIFFSILFLSCFCAVDERFVKKDFVKKDLYVPQKGEYVNDLRISLTKRGWKLVKEITKDVSFQWVTGTTDVKTEDYEADRLINHFPSVAGVASKLHIFRNLRRNTLFESGLNYLDFFSLCFSFKNLKERLDFVDHFRLFRCKLVLHNFLKKIEKDPFPIFTEQQLFRIQVCLIYSESYIESKKYLLEFEKNNSLPFPSTKAEPRRFKRPSLTNGLIYANSSFEPIVLLTEQDWYMVSSSCVENVSAIAQAGLSDSIPPSPLGSLPLPDMLALIVRVKSTYPQLYQLLSNTNILNAQILNDRDIGRRNGSELYSRPPLNPDMGAGPGGGTGAGARAELLSLAAQDTVEPPGIMQAGARNLWIVKPAYLSRARGIEVFDNMSEIFDYVQVEPKTVYVVQKYMGRAHLLAKRKYDIRLWVLMSSHTPLYLFLYNDSYFRVSSSLYDMRNISSGIHITNLILQEKSTEYDGSWQHEIGAGATSNSFNISTFLKNLARLDREQQKGRKEVVVPNTMIIGGGSGGGNDNSNIKSIKNSGKTKKLTPLQRRIEREKQEDSEEYDNNVDTFGFIDPVYPPFSYMERWKTVTLPEIRKIVVATMKAGRAGYSVGKTTYWFRDRKKSFEFFGFDIMFDVDFHPWLIEVNMGPSLEHRNPIMSPLIVTVIEDMVKIAVDNQIYSQSDSLALIERLIASTPKSLSFSDRSSSTSSSTSSSPSSSSKLPWFRSWSSKRSDSSASSSSSSTPSSSSSPTFFASASSFLSSPFFGADKDEMVADFNRLHVNTGGWNLVFREKMFSDSDDVTTTEEPFDL